MGTHNYHKIKDKISNKHNHFKYICLNKYKYDQAPHHLNSWNGLNSNNLYRFHPPWYSPCQKGLQRANLNVKGDVFATLYDMGSHNNDFLTARLTLRVFLRPLTFRWNVDWVSRNEISMLKWFMFSKRQM